MTRHRYPPMVEQALWHIGQVDDLLEIGESNYNLLKPHLDYVSKAIIILGEYYVKRKEKDAASDVPRT